MEHYGKRSVEVAFDFLMAGPRHTTRPVDPLIRVSGCSCGGGGGHWLDCGLGSTVLPRGHADAAGIQEVSDGESGEED